MNDFVKNKRILVTGACGTIGSELISQLLTNPEYSPEEVIGLDNNESQLFFMEQRYIDDARAHFYVADTQHFPQANIFRCMKRHRVKSGSKVK